MSGKLLEPELVSAIVNAFYTVYNYFGYGLLESVYAGALEHELTVRGHHVKRELLVEVTYKKQRIGWQRLDMVIDHRVVVELKSTEVLPSFSSRQLVNYLRATTFEVGVLLHFGPKPRFYRFVDTKQKVRRSPDHRGH